jgi:two-component system alkaline phosphatase synthesis response regulator PhoP
MAEECILIVEDERAVARGLEYGFAREGFEVLLAENGLHAIELTRIHDPHVILLDIRLPDKSGFDVCKQLRNEGRHMPILMLTARDEEIDKVLGLELGADDYIVKPFSVREVISRVRAQLRRAYGELAVSANHEKLRFGSIEIDLEKVQVLRSGEPVPVTPIEFRLLRYLVNHPNRPFSRGALIEEVWGYNDEISSDRTIDVHIRHLRQKIEDDSANPCWILTVRGFGYKFQP